MPRSPKRRDEAAAARSPEERIANLLALQVTREMDQQDKISTMSVAGFSNADIAHLVGTSEATVRATLSRVRGRSRSSRGNGG